MNHSPPPPPPHTHTKIMSGRRGSASVEHLKLLQTAFYGAIPVTQRRLCGIKGGGLDLLSSTLMIEHDQNNPPLYDNNEGVTPSS